MLPRFRVPRSSAAVAVLVASALAHPGVARAGLGVGPSAPLDPTKILAVRTQERAAAAGDGNTTLFAWVDLRSGNPDVYAARVLADGTLLDPNGIAVATTGTGEDSPAVSWNGNNWLVVFVKDGHVYGARVDAGGEVLDPSPLEIGVGGQTDDSPAAAGLDGSHCVVWRSGGNDHAIWGALVAHDGSFTASPAALTAPGAGFSDGAPAIAVIDGTSGLVAFTTDRNGNADIYGVRVEAGLSSLDRVDASDFAISAGPARTDQPAVAASDNGWMVAWEDGRHAGTAVDVFAARVGAGGAVLDANGIEVVDDAGNDTDPAVVHTGTQWLVAWSQDGVGQFVRAVANNGNPANAQTEVSTTPGTVGRGAFGGEAATPILAWSEPEPDAALPKPPQDLLGVVLEQNLTFDPSFPIATQTPNQTQPAMAFGAGRWLIAWVDDRYGPTEGMLRYVVTDSAKVVVEPEDIKAVKLAPGRGQAQPAACFDGTNFNVFWTEVTGGLRRIEGARFTAGGAPIDTFPVANGAWDHADPTCAEHDDGRVIVAWTDHRNGVHTDIWGRVVVDGSWLGDEEFLANSATNESKPRLAPRVVDSENNSSFLAYQESSGPGTGEITGRYLYLVPDLTSSSEYSIRSDAGRVYESPQIAWNGNMWVVTYQEFVENDGPGLYVPFANWIGHPFNTVSSSRQIGPGSYVPANPIVGSAAANFVTLRSRLDGAQVDLDIRRAEGSPGFVETEPVPYTSDAEVDVPGAAAQGQGDRVGLLHLRRQDDADWDGLRLFGADVQDTLAGRVVINEFLANPPMGTDEFYELFNVSGQSFQLLGWVLVVDGDSTEVVNCFIDAPGPGPDAAKGGGDVVQGTICGVLPDASYQQSEDFFGIAGTPQEGKLPNRGAVLELFSSGGVKVDQVAYGYKGGAPVSPPLPVGEMPVAKLPVLAAPGDSVALSTARLPDGGDTDSDANDWNVTTNSTPGDPNVGTAAALNTSLIVTRLFWNPQAPGVDAIELFNPYDQDIDFSNWYVGTNDGTQRVGVPGNAWSVLRRLDKRVLRRGETGSFTTDLDYLTVVYLYKPDFTRVEQLGWSRTDNQQPQMCMRRDPDTGGFHDGFDWLSSGGELELFVGQLHYEACPISAPDATVGAGDGPGSLAFRGAVPNPSAPGRGMLVFTVPGVSGGAAAHVRVRLVDVAGRVRATLVDGPMTPGEHRIGLSSEVAGIYYAELQVGGRRITRPVVVVR